MTRGCLPAVPYAVVPGRGRRLRWGRGVAIQHGFAGVEGAAPRAVLVAEGCCGLMTSAAGRQVTVHYARGGDVLGVPVLGGGLVNVAVQSLAPSSLFRTTPQRLTRAVLARTDRRRDPSLTTFAIASYDYYSLAGPAHVMCTRADSTSTAWLPSSTEPT
jgi:hypothetical protein